MLKGLNLSDSATNTSDKGKAMSQLNFDQARFNMVEQQIRTWTVLDTKVLDVMMQIPREAFVPDAYKNMAYSDIGIPLDHAQEMMHPKIEAHMLQALNIQENDNVLEIGTGSGYATALMASLGKHVTSVEIYPDLLRRAGMRLSGLNISNVTLEEGDAIDGWPEHGPYDAIAVTGAVHTVSDKLKNNLTIGGRLFVIVGNSPVMEAMLIERKSESEFEQTAILETEIAYLTNGEKPKSFEF